ncbi:MAG: hypothetical protein WCC65_05475, partial [Pseudonocardiaceae bacterium]
MSRWYPPRAVHRGTPGTVPRFPPPDSVHRVWPLRLFTASVQQARGARTLHRAGTVPAVAHDSLPPDPFAGDPEDPALALDA